MPLFAESALCLAVSLYWSQLGGRIEPAYHAKTTSRRYEAVTDVSDVRGLLLQLNTALVPVLLTQHLLWASVNGFMQRMRAVEHREQFLEHASQRTSIGYSWRLQRAVPAWDAFPRLAASLARPKCLIEILMRRPAS
ncbi:hypothetical protein DFH07DRAFT_859743 [Mycena maculata]|uniref:Uncharacterized protein n=1 Tax=Mycena maculata TaxID=230809 RepID=A0AAD7HG49_9AGAR|nr:hypothetical protein DFH07DRAFT_859743 [Mycena maculata]